MIMTQPQLARMLLLQIEAVREHKGDMTSLLTLTNEVFRDAERLAKEIIECQHTEIIDLKNS